MYYGSRMRDLPYNRNRTNPAGYISGIRVQIQTRPVYARSIKIKQN